MTDLVVGQNRVVSVTYSIVDKESGEVIEQSDLPVEYLHGSEDGLFEKIEEALEGKGVDEQVTVTLEAIDAFGEWEADLTFSDQIENVPEDYRKLGAEASFRNDEGDTITMIVTHIDDGTISLDGNHPFAGKTVTFHMKIQAIREATEQELRDGVNPNQRPTIH